MKQPAPGEAPDTTLINTLKRLTVVLMAALAAAAYAGPPPGAQIVRAGNSFGFRLLSSVLTRQPWRNTVISPTSVTLALAMAWNGARGESHDSMARALGYPDIEPDVINIANSALLALLQSHGPQEQLEIANSLWVRNGVPLAQDYIQTCEDFYDAKLAALDLGDPKSVDLINNWVRQKTHDRIQGIVPQLDVRDVLILVNAVYFKAQWSRQFDPNLTREQDFYLPSGRVRPTKMMRTRGEYQYYASSRFQLVSLPYGDGRFSMLVFLPVRLEPEEPTRDDQGNVTNAHLAKAVWDLVERMNLETWQRWQDSMATVEGEIVLPRLTLEYEEALGPALSELGMSIAFNPPRADFSGMLPAPIDMPFCLNEVLHKTFIEVNEESTEAAAVTSIKKEAGAASGRQPFLVVVNRPFLFAIVDNKSAAVLLLATVFDPGA